MDWNEWITCCTAKKLPSAGTTTRMVHKKRDVKRAGMPVGKREDANTGLVGRVKVSSLVQAIVCVGSYARYGGLRKPTPRWLGRSPCSTVRVMRSPVIRQLGLILDVSPPDR